jgi:hypothetical protein
LAASERTGRRTGRLDEATDAGDRQGVDQPWKESPCRRTTAARQPGSALGRPLLLLVSAVVSQHEPRTLHWGPAVRQLMSDHSGILDSIRRHARQVDH